MNSTTNLPHRLSESAFRTYEPIIAKAITSFPIPFILPVTDIHKCGCASSTFVARLRDAIKSYRDHCWVSAIVNQHKFIQVQNDLMVSHKSDGRIIIGPRNAHSKFDTIMSADSEVLADEKIDILLTTWEQKTMICHLAEHKAFRCALHVTGLTKEEILMLEKNHDVSFRDNKNDSYTLL